MSMNSDNSTDSPTLPITGIVLLANTGALVSVPVTRAKTNKN